MNKIGLLLSKLTIVFFFAMAILSLSNCTDAYAPIHNSDYSEQDSFEVRDTFKFITDNGMSVSIRSENRAMFAMHTCCNYLWQCAKSDSVLTQAAPFYCVANNSEDIGEVLGNFANDSVDIEIIAEHQGNGVYSQGPCNQIRISTTDYQGVCDLTVPGSYNCP